MRWYSIMRPAIWAAGSTQSIMPVAIAEPGMPLA